MAKAKKAAAKKSTKKATPCKCKSLGYVYVSLDSNNSFVDETLYSSISEAEKDWNVQDALAEGREFAIAELKQVRYKAGRPSAAEAILWDETCD